MRIISADRDIDINYDMCTLHVVTLVEGKRYAIKAFTHDHVEVILGGYSSIEKCISIMSDIRNCYISASNTPKVFNMPKEMRD